MDIMNILVLSDQVSAALWEHFEKSRLDRVDLILACGDLPAEYLSFLATFFHGPVLYIRGNHDDSYEDHPPEGCICIEDDIYVYRGIRILGLGGSLRYKPGRNQYTEREMNRRVRRLWLKLHRNKGFDTLMTHAPAYGIGDGEGAVHTGFLTFVRLLEKYSPRFFVHGHMHLNYGGSARRLSRYQNTVVVNAFEKFVIEYE